MTTADKILSPLAHFPAHIFEEDIVIHHRSTRVIVHRYKFRLFADARAARTRFVCGGAWQGARSGCAAGACVNRDTVWAEYTLPRLASGGGIRLTRHG
jgi:hypothetical protein